MIKGKKSTAVFFAAIILIFSNLGVETMAMNNIPRISDAEWIVMRILWESSPLTANQIVETLSPNTSWNPRTIKTLINRLVKKEAVGAIRKTREFKFFPIVGT